MDLKRLGLIGGAAIALGGVAFAADQYFGIVSGPDQPQLAVDGEQAKLTAEAIATDCGLTNASNDETAKAGLVSASVTRARITAGQGIAGVDDVSTAIEAGDCRFRLDGVWLQDIQLALDPEVRIDGFDAGSGAVLDQSLLHSTYLSPEILLVEANADGTELTIRSAMQDGEVITARAADETPMSEVLQIDGTRKTYLVGDQTAPSEDASIFLDVTKTGRVRLRIGGQNFYRPKADAAGNQATSINDAWMIERNLDNINASLKGYDVVTQDLFRLNQNPKAPLFEAADPLAYTVTEKRTVPLGLKLVAEGPQGSVINNTLIRTEREFQRTVAWHVGGEVGFKRPSFEGAVGVNYAQSNTSGMREGSANSIASGYARHKIYTLVLDRPFVRLTNEFVDAIEDARRYGRYDELITRFGTHYPYAVSYGSAAKMTAEFSENTLATWEQGSTDINAKAAGAIKGFGASLSGGRFEEEREENSDLESAEATSFEAVGGTGSFSQEGHATGTPYPILADLRPLYHLLNPLNFPGEPEVYNEVRENLRLATEKYLEEHAQQLSDVRPEIERQYVVRAYSLRCERDRNDAVFSDNGKVKLFGSLTLKHAKGGKRSGQADNRMGFSNHRGDVIIDCKGGGNRRFDAGRATTITGKKSELEGKVRFEWSAGSFAGQRQVAFGKKVTYANGGISGFDLPVELKVNESQTIKQYVVNTHSRPKLAVVAEVKRVR